VLALSLVLASCVDSRRTNPLDGDQLSGLFFPQITRPAGAEQWFGGTEQEIRWTPAQKVSDAVVSLYLVYRDTTVVIAHQIPNTGQFLWTVPNLSAASCRIRVANSRGYTDGKGTFRLNPAPVLERMETGGAGWEPAALRNRIVFTSDRGGSDDLWLLDRDTGELAPLTDASGLDGEADWFKPNGNVLVFTSDRTGRKEVWVININERKPLQVTTKGGEHPAWQPSFFEYPTVAYTRLDERRRMHIFTTTLQVPTSEVHALTDPIPVFPEYRVTSDRSTIGSITDIRTLQWGAPGTENILLYDTGDLLSRLWRLDVPFDQSAQRISAQDQPEGLAIPYILFPAHPSFSRSGARVAFESDGDLYMISLFRKTPIQLTFGPEEDDFPDWASESEIVFQRRASPSDPWEIWTLQVPEVEE
jgi:hypothetical protein